MQLLLTSVGLLVIAVTLYDVFHQLVHPAGKGRVSLWVTRSVWVLFRTLGCWKSSLLELAGPVAFLSVMFSWATLLSIGWAFIYWAFLPGGFNLAPGMAGSGNSGFADALYLSVVSLATLGYGDIVPKYTWLRILAPAEALVGFALLSAGITWLLSLYPALSSLRAFAHSVHLVRSAAGGSASLCTPQPVSQCQILLEFASRLTALRSRFVQSPIIYYFHTSDPVNALNLALPWLLEVSVCLSRPDNAPDVRFAATVLRNAVADFAAVLGRSFLGLPKARPDEILAAYAKDHLQSVSGTTDLVGDESSNP